jgi:hypothetical protein
MLYSKHFFAADEKGFTPPPCMTFLPQIYYVTDFYKQPKD